MSINCIFLIIKDICFFAAIIMLVILIAEVHKSNKNTKDGSGTVEQQQKNDHYKIALKETPKKISIGILVSVVTVVLFFNITNITIQQITDFFKTKNISICYVIVLLISIFVIVTVNVFNKQVKEAAYYLYYDEFYEHGEYVIISTDEKKVYNFPRIYKRLDIDKLHKEYLLERAKNNYDLLKLLSPIPVISLIINIIATYFKNSNINTSLLTVVIIAMIFAYVIFALMINRRINRIKFDLWRNDDCKMNIENKEEEYLKNKERESLNNDSK